MKRKTPGAVAPTGARLVAAPSSPPRSLLWRFDRHEFAGSVGDIGVMIPLAVGCAAAAGLSLVTVFLCVAASYAATALVFRVPVPVQPMKAMAATVIALGLSASVVAAASIEISLIFLLLAVTPLPRYLARLFPRAVVRGIQLAVGLLLLKSALTLAGGGQALPGVPGSLELGAVHVAVGSIAALIVLAVLLAGRERQRLPASLVVVGMGAIVGIALTVLGASQVAGVPAASALPPAHLPSLHDAWIAFFALTLPQLPLSLGNSVFAADDALRHYFPGRAGRVTPRRLVASLGLMNLGCGLVGAMPLCHGAGGVTAAYRLGARTAGAALIAACLYGALAAAAAFGVSPLLVPGAVLAGMLLFVGVEHCLLLTDLVTLDEVLTALLIAVLAFAVNDLAIGFLAGWVVYMGLQRTSLRRTRLRWPSLTGRLAPPPSSLETELS